MKGDTLYYLLYSSRVSKKSESYYLHASLQYCTVASYDCSLLAGVEKRRSGKFFLVLSSILHPPNKHQQLGRHNIHTHTHIYIFNFRASRKILNYRPFDDPRVYILYCTISNYISLSVDILSVDILSGGLYLC